MFLLSWISLVSFFASNYACGPTTGTTPFSSPVFYMTYAPSVDMTYPVSQNKFRYRFRKQRQVDPCAAEFTTMAPTTTSTAAATAGTNGTVNATMATSVATSHPTTTEEDNSTTSEAGLVVKELFRVVRQANPSCILNNQSTNESQATASARGDVTNAINAALAYYNYTGPNVNIDLSTLTGMAINLCIANCQQGEGLVNAQGSVMYLCQAPQCSTSPMTGFVEIEEQLAIPVTNGPALTLTQWQAVATRIRNTLAEIGVYFYGDIEAQTG